MKRTNTVEQHDRQRKLELRKERVRELRSEQLDKVNGGQLRPTSICPTTQL